MKHYSAISRTGPRPLCRFKPEEEIDVLACTVQEFDCAPCLRRLQKLLIETLTAYRKRELGVS